MSYVLLREHGEYDQYGCYFVSWFHEKPSASEIYKVINEDDYLPKQKLDEYSNWILNTGGRKDNDCVWYFLKKVKSSNIKVKK